MAWSIMTAFDAVQVLGSHQNVFTFKMVEGLGLNHRHAVILDLEEFPNGIMYVLLPVLSVCLSVCPLCSFVYWLPALLAVSISAFSLLYYSASHHMA